MTTTSVVRAQRPLHHQASSLVVEAKKNLEDTWDVEGAIAKLEQVYSIAERMIPQLDQETSVPWSVTDHLVNLLEMDEIQCEDKLKYSIAKACRIFMDLTFIQAVATHRTIRPDTHKKILEKLKKVIETVPSEQALTKYELRCCWATALVLNSASMYLKQFFINNIGDVVEAIAAQSPGKLVGPLKQVLTDLWNLIDTYWFTEVFCLHLQGKVQILNFNYTSSTDFKGFYQALPMIREYKKASETAHCFFGFLRLAMDKSVEAKNFSLQLKLLNGEDSDTAPGLIDLTEYGKDDLLDRLYSSWSVRYEAINFLFYISQQETVREDVWKIILTLLANKFASQENKHVSSLIRRSLRILRTNFNQKSLRPRVDYFLGQVKGTIKLEKGVPEEIEALRRKRQHLHTELKSQMAALNDKKETLHELPVIVPFQQDSRSEEAQRLAAEQKKSLESEVKDLESKLNKMTDTVEQVEMQEEFLSLLELKGK